MRDKPTLEQWVPPLHVRPSEAWANYRTHDWTPRVEPERGYVCGRCGKLAVSLWADWPCPADSAFPVEVYTSVMSVYPEWGWWPEGIDAELVDGWMAEDPPVDEVEYGDE